MTDACVTEVVTEVKSLKKGIFKNTIVIKEKDTTRNDPIWKELVDEVKLKKGYKLTPLAKL